MRNDFIVTNLSLHPIIPFYSFLITIQTTECFLFRKAYNLHDNLHGPSPRWTTAQQQKKMFNLTLYFLVANIPVICNWNL